MRLRYFRNFVSSLVSISFLWSGWVLGAGKHPPQSSEIHWVGKKVVAWTPMEDNQISLPDGSTSHFGEDFEASLTSRLMQSGKYLLIEAPLLESRVLHEESLTPKYVWNGSEMPSVTIQVQVEAISFQTGGGGDRLFYGFDERLKTSFNDGLHPPKNEFPLRLAQDGSEVSWFGQTFDRKGVEPFDSQSGLDLGEGFQADFLYAFLNLKYSAYRVALRLRLLLESPLGVAPFNKLIQVQGDGFFMDFVGGYAGYSAGIVLARKDAMNQAVKKAIDASYSALESALAPTPWLAKVDGVISSSAILLGTGAGSDIQLGTVYQSLAYPDLQVQIQESNESGSVGQVIRGDFHLLKEGMILQEVSSARGTPFHDFVGTPHSLAMAEVPDLVETVQLPLSHLTPADFTQVVPLVSRLEATLKSVAGLVFLPYRIWRYFSYDQDYHSQADSGGKREYSKNEKKNLAWQHLIGLDQAGPMRDQDPSQPLTVAILDSGVDYNHFSLHDHLWLNPNPQSDGEGRVDRYGWDFISNDARPYDDGYHGTEVASIVAAIAPQAKILPLKVFNPWGITSSAALEGAFHYAVDHGAKVILCAWATRIPSEAIQKGVEYAQNHGVIVVAAAGDQGMNLSVLPVYPAVLSATYDNILTVTSTGVDQHGQDAPIQARGQKGGMSPNFDPKGTWIQLAAPGESIAVAEPRGGYAVSTSSGNAAAVVAGVLLRNISANEFEPSYQSRITQILQEADSVPSLQELSRGGRRVKVMR